MWKFSHHEEREKREQRRPECPAMSREPQAISPSGTSRANTAGVRHRDTLEVPRADRSRPRPSWCQAAQLAASETDVIDEPPKLAQSPETGRTRPIRIRSNRQSGALTIDRHDPTLLLETPSPSAPRCAPPSADATRTDPTRTPSLRFSCRPSGSAMHRCAEPRLIARVGAAAPSIFSSARARPERIARQLGARGVGQVLALPRHHHRQQPAPAAAPAMIGDDPDRRRR